MIGLRAARPAVSNCSDSAHKSVRTQSDPPLLLQFASSSEGVFTSTGAFIDYDIQELFIPTVAQPASNARPKAMNAELFLNAFIMVVLPHLCAFPGPNSILIMDNAGNSMLPLIQHPLVCVRLFW